jgi:methylmalonyl-CoA/ethylmalonyl-CoA epimerase
MPAQLNHIGIAVKDAASLGRLKRLFELLGLPSGHIEAVPEQGVVTHFVDLPAEPGHLEFLEVTDPQGTVAQFIEKRGPGVHHLSFLLPRGELDATSDRLKKDGFRLVYEQPRLGAHSMRVNFVHPSTAGGLLVEIMESTQGGA